MEACGTGWAIGPGGQEPVSAFVLLSRICWRSGNTRVGSLVRWFSPGESYSSVSESLICPEYGNIANSGPFVFVLFSSDVPAPFGEAPRSFCSHEYVSGSPSASVALPVRANGVRSGIVYCAGAETSGMEFPFGTSVPWLSTAPPLSVSPTKPDAIALKPPSWSMNGTFVCASVPVKVTWKPVLLKAPPPKPATVTVPPAGKSGVIAAAMPAAE